MGSVVMKRESTDIRGLYDAELVTSYVYCDECGSFRIVWFPPLKAIAIVFTLVGLIAVPLWYGMRDGALPGALLACWGMPPLIALLMVSPESGHLCLECWSLRVSKANTRNYSEGDTSVPDVPEHVVHKHQRVW